MHSAMFISLSEITRLDKGMLQAFVEDRQVHPFQTIPPFSLCKIPVQLLVWICSRQRAKFSSSSPKVLEQW